MFFCDVELFILLYSTTVYDQLFVHVPMKQANLGRCDFSIHTKSHKLKSSKATSISFLWEK